MYSPYIISMFCFAFGAIIGSFLSVCIYRIPLGKYDPVHEGAIPVPEEDVSIWSPARSFCPKCQKQLLWWHNIPILSWLFLGGKCGFCKSAVPFRYVFIEVLSAIACVFCYLRFGMTPTAVLAFVFVATMIVICFIDLDYMIIPNVISYPGTVIGFILAAINQFLSPPERLLLSDPFSPSLLHSGLGVLGSAGLLYAVWWLYLKLRGREGLGLGDVKLLAMIGATFGIECALFTIFIGSMLGSVVGIGLACLSKHGFSNYIPFGPYLVVAVVTFILGGPDVYELFVYGRIPPHWGVLQ